MYIRCNLDALSMYPRCNLNAHSLSNDWPMRLTARLSRVHGARWNCTNVGPTSLVDQLDRLACASEMRAEGSDFKLCSPSRPIGSVTDGILLNRVAVSDGLCVHSSGKCPESTLWPESVVLRRANAGESSTRIKRRSARSTRMRSGHSESGESE